MNRAPQSFETNSYRNGIFLALTVYTAWGFFPIYFKLMNAVHPIELLAHRILWALPFGALVILFRRQLPEVKAALLDKKTRGFLTLSAFFIAINWGTYIWAVHLDEIMQASLGYYLNPLIYVLVGVVFFKEKLTRLQCIAVVLAVFGVLWLIISGGDVPVIAIVLAVTFTIYGVIRKQVVVGGMPGLFIESLVLFPIGAVYLGYLYATGSNTFGFDNLGLSVGFMLAGPLTVFPLLAFALSARRLPLSTIGILQFIAPTLQFGTAMYYGEPLTQPRLICFGFIWTAVAIFCFAAWRKSKALRVASLPL